MFTAFGMIFQLVRGKAVHHVVKTFAENINNTAMAENFLLLPEIEAPFISLGHILTTNWVTFYSILNKIVFTWLQFFFSFLARL